MSVSFGGGYLRTKLELLRLRRSLRTAERVYRILEDKRDVLVRRINELIDEAQELREALNAKLSEAYQELITAYLKSGPKTIQTITSTLPETLKVKVGSYTMMGIQVPTVELEEVSFPLPYGFLETSVHLDEASRKLRSVIGDICRAAAVENAIFRIAEELKRTQRLLNALEYVIMPKYRNAIKEIAMSLEESDRDYFVKLKHVKRVLERRKIGAAQERTVQVG
ncbi:MAG: V-type ATP synthase subunit D [Thaumarchaeota archaeon]|nr:V-type ATP synthase subunit D [Candidatus Calditenuaceae archaeon]MDW8042486.1 V-type ATP synthase subunit D [Nitrososphaerota archaeon]